MVYKQQTHCPLCISNENYRFQRADKKFVGLKQEVFI